ncbi:hypothetical protein HG530_009478 [Fusarium avenaceum]|nr:hypothetical protein HG530_009478 [Fusarium avenaceum]
MSCILLGVEMRRMRGTVTKLIQSRHRHVQSNTSPTALIPEEKILLTGKARKFLANTIRESEQIGTDGIVSLAQEFLKEEVVALLEKILQMRLDLKGLVSEEIELEMGSHDKGVESFAFVGMSG